MGKLLGSARDGGELPRAGAQQRVWRSLQQPRQASAARWLIPLVASAAAALAAFVLWPKPAPVSPEAFATVTLAAGDVESADDSAKWSPARVGQSLPEGSQLRTAGKSRAYTRLPGAGALFHEGTRARLARVDRRVDITLQDGSIAAAVRTSSPKGETNSLGMRVLAAAYSVEVEGTLFQVSVAADRVVDVYVHEGVVHVTGPETDVRVRAGESWSSRKGLGHDAMQAADISAARALASAQTDEAVLRIVKPKGAQISLDGVELGTAPLEVLAKIGAHDVAGVHQGLRSSAHTTLAAQGGSFELPEAQPVPLPDVTFEALEPEEATPVPSAPSKVQPPADPSKRYMLARQLARQGRTAEALGLYEELANGKSGWAEASLYEIGRLELRAKKNLPAAKTAFTEYRRRYPNGALAPEVSLSAIEVELKLGAADAALQEMDSFLSAFPTSERRHEVRFVRATVRRDRGDCAGASDDYLQLLETARADDALYFAAVCEQQLGKDAAARAHLSEYLRRFPAGVHFADVKRFFEGVR